MTEAVLDASVVVKWFHAEGERHVEAARALRHRFETGGLRVLAPPLLWLEILNVAARRWGWTAASLAELAGLMKDLGFELIDPDIAAVARWAAWGLTAYDAAYLAIAEHADVPLVTDDGQIVQVAPQIALALGGELTLDG